MANDQSIDFKEAHKKLSADVVSHKIDGEKPSLTKEDVAGLVSSMEVEANEGRYSSQLLEMATLLADSSQAENPFQNERLKSAFERQRSFNNEIESRYSEISDKGLEIPLDPYGQANELNSIEFLPYPNRENTGLFEKDLNPLKDDVTGEESSDEDPDINEKPEKQPTLTPQEAFAQAQSIEFTAVEENSSSVNTADLLAMPAHIKEKFREGRDGKYFFTEGKDADKIAFRDEKDKLSTTRDDTLIAHSLVDVAESRDWQTVRVQGSHAFRREVWLEASARGLEVEGYKAKRRDLEDLDKRKAELGRRTNSLDDISTLERDKALHDSREIAPEAAEATNPTHSPAEQANGAQKAPVDRLEGKVISHGKAPYQNNDKNKDSYFVELENTDGQRNTQWGVDLERAVNESGIDEGDNVKLEDKGSQPVKVNAPEFDKSGKFIGTKTIETQRRTWAVHAKAIREQKPEELAQNHPELTNEAAWMKAADVAVGQRLQEADRTDFNNRVREEMADRAERGQRAPEFKVKKPLEREPAQPETNRSPQEPSR